MLTDRLTDAQKLQLATYGTLDDIWLIEAYFSHLTPGPVFDATRDTRQEVYRRVADFLMSENIQRIVVRRNGEIQQTIDVSSLTNLC